MSSLATAVRARLGSKLHGGLATRCARISRNTAGTRSHSTRGPAGTQTSPVSSKSEPASRSTAGVVPPTHAASTQSPPAHTNLEKIIRSTIKASGPMSVATYMQLCLSHPTDGYYMNPAHAVLGARGDFITSPEISQVFGELLGIWHLMRWEAAGRPARIRIVELGPGRGTLMADMLRAMSQIRACAGAIRAVHLVETSRSMRALQRAALVPAARAPPRPPWSVEWFDSVEDLLDPRLAREDEYVMVVAHEFFDALPVHLIEKLAQGWHEVFVSCLPKPALDHIIHPSPSEPLHFVREPAPSPAARILGASSPRFDKLPIGARLEVSPASFKIARQVAQLLSNSRGKGGSALIVDYGNDHAFGTSLRGFKDHKIVDVFHRPGECDLTANVDFAYLKEAMAGSAFAHGPMPQSAFLNQMGIGTRVSALVRGAKTEERKVEIERAALRLVDATGMGSQYKVMGVTCDPVASGGPACRDGESEPGRVWPFTDLPNVE